MIIHAERRSNAASAVCVSCWRCSFWSRENVTRPARGLRHQMKIASPLWLQYSVAGRYDRSWTRRDVVRASRSQRRSPTTGRVLTVVRWRPTCSDVAAAPPFSTPPLDCRRHSASRMTSSWRLSASYVMTYVIMWCVWLGTTRDLCHDAVRRHRAVLPTWHDTWRKYCRCMTSAWRWLSASFGASRQQCLSPAQLLRLKSTKPASVRRQSTDETSV